MKRINYFSEHPPVESPDYDLIIEPRCEFCLAVFAKGTTCAPLCSLRKQHPERCVLDQENIFKENYHET